MSASAAELKYIDGEENRATGGVVVDLLPHERQRGRTERSSYPRVSVVIPTLNEAKNIGGVLGRIPAVVDQVIVVDGGSTDGTEQAALAAPCLASVSVIQQRGMGKGNALSCGFGKVHDGIVVMLDADGSMDPEEISKFIEPLINGADFAKGSRFAAGGGSSDITYLRRFGNYGLTCLVNMVWRVRYTDLCYGYNAFWADLVPQLDIACAPGFEIETLLNIRAASIGASVVEVGSYEADRIHGVSNLNARRDGLRVLRTILAEWIRPS